MSRKLIKIFSYVSILQVMEEERGKKYLELVIEAEKLYECKLFPCYNVVVVHIKLPQYMHKFKSPPWEYL